jgi:hypothetical protein
MAEQPEQNGLREFVSHLSSGDNKGNKHRTKAVQNKCIKCFFRSILYFVTFPDIKIFIWYLIFREEHNCLYMKAERLGN